MTVIRPTFAGAVLALLLTVLPVFAGGVAGQQRMALRLPGEDPELVDRVVAVVGDSVVFLSELTEEMLLLAAQRPLPEDSVELRTAARNLLDQLVNLEIILQRAQRDSTLLPSEAEVEAQVTETVENVRSQFPSPQQFQEALEQDGLTTTTYRERLARRIREQQIQQLFVERQLREAPAVAVTEAEMREVFEAQRAQIGERPEAISFDQIILRPSVEEGAWAEARQLADSVRQALMEGADFATLAAEHSDDSGNAQQGGELPWFRRGTMVRQFEDVAFALGDGQVSLPVRTDFGWHIIRVDRRRPGEVKARHILIMPESTDADTERAGDSAAGIAELARAGEDFDSLRQEFGDTEQRTSFDEVTRAQIAEAFPPGYAEALQEVEEGEIVGPFTTSLGAAPVNVILRVREVREGGEVTFEDVREQIRQQLQQQKRLQRIWESLRANTYVDIRF